MEPDGRDCHPHPNDVYVPRMICAQFNNMGYCTILRRVRKQLLEELWRMMASKSPQHFFTIYLAVFMMLHEISVTTRDRYRWAEENNQVSRLMCSPKKNKKEKLTVVQRKATRSPARSRRSRKAPTSSSVTGTTTSAASTP